ncbi:MAG: hypothetical protein ABI538_09110 [Pseudoxanthomonas sp.]
MLVPRCVAALLAFGFLVALMSACDEAPGQRGAAARPGGPATAATADSTAAGTGACRLLTQSDVREALPGVGQGKSGDSLAQAGMQACEWTGDHGRFTAQISTAGTGTADRDIHGLVDSFIDPMRRDAIGQIRFENITGVGDDATAVLEQRDESRGILNDVAILVVHRGGDSERAAVTMSGSRAAPCS